MTGTLQLRISPLWIVALLIASFSINAAAQPCLIDRASSFIENGKMESDADNGFHSTGESNNPLKFIALGEYDNFLHASTFNELVRSAANGDCNGRIDKTDSDSEIVGQIIFKIGINVSLFDSIYFEAPDGKDLLIINESNKTVEFREGSMPFGSSRVRGPECAVTLGGRVKFVATQFNDHGLAKRDNEFDSVLRDEHGDFVKVDWGDGTEFVKNREPGPWHFHMLSSSGVCLTGNHNELKWVEVSGRNETGSIALRDAQYARNQQSDIEVVKNQENASSIILDCEIDTPYCLNERLDGIKIDGNHNTVRNSVVHQISGHGIVIEGGSNNEIRDTEIFDLDLYGDDGDNFLPIIRMPGANTDNVKLRYLRAIPDQDESTPTSYTLKAEIASSRNVSGIIEFYRMDEDGGLNLFIDSATIINGKVEKNIQIQRNTTANYITGVVCIKSESSGCDQEYEEKESLGSSGEASGVAYLSHDSDDSDNVVSPCEGASGDLLEDCIKNFNGDDRDGDGVKNDLDNCPDVENPDQLNTDLASDGGDACDDDDDNDGTLDATDDCFGEADSGEDLDGDGTDNACDADDDGDGIDDLEDNCPIDANPLQGDQGGNGVGDACELDTDEDGINDDVDSCPNVKNEGEDDDGDGIDDVCDKCDPVTEIEMGAGICKLKSDFNCADNETATAEGCKPKVKICHGALVQNSEGECVEEEDDGDDSRSGEGGLPIITTSETEPCPASGFRSNGAVCTPAKPKGFMSCSLAQIPSEPNANQFRLYLLSFFAILFSIIAIRFRINS